MYVYNCAVHACARSSATANSRPIIIGNLLYTMDLSLALFTPLSPLFIDAALIVAGFYSSRKSRARQPAGRAISIATRWRIRNQRAYRQSG